MATTDTATSMATFPALTDTTRQVADYVLQPGQDFSGYLQQALARMGELSQGYGGQRVAGFSPLQQYAQSQAMDLPGATSAYMSPYINNVVNRIDELGNRNLMENILPNINSTFTGNGQFGSTRNADFTNRAIRDTQNEILGNQANALNTAQQQAYGNLFQGLGAQTTLGNQQQALQQQAMDTGYQDWLNSFALPTQQAGALSSIYGQVAAAAPSGSSTAQTQITPDTNWYNLVGSLPGILASIGSGGTNGTNVSGVLQSLLGGGNTNTASSATPVIN